MIGPCALQTLRRCGRLTSRPYDGAPGGSPRRGAACCAHFAAIAALFLLPVTCLAQEPPPTIPEGETSAQGEAAATLAEALMTGVAPSDVRAEVDEKDESGAKAVVSWKAPLGKPLGDQELKGYRLYRAADDGEFVGLLEPVTNPDTIEEEGQAPRLGTQVSDLWTWHSYRFKVAALYGPKDNPAEVEAKGGPRPWYMEGQLEPEDLGDWESAVVVIEELSPDASPPIQTRAKWYRLNRTNILIGVLLYSVVVVWFIHHARSGKEIYVRPIAGIEAIDEAIGRATEMGKPILYVSGLTGLGSISTITAMTILGRVARRTAEYETPLLVPCVDPLVMLAAREIVREAYLDAGKPDAYREQDVFFVTDRQFAYVAGVDGIMLREQPAANLYMGYFYAEALILAETGSVTGAIQIAGTDADTQIPFFVTACDYTLMGEELYAATAYLSREPMLLAQLRAQDVGKAALGALIAASMVAASVAAFLTAGGMSRAADLITAALDLFRPL
ncbi:MAG: fibronectin type III domain-containing protein [Armatimonadetes bacterium]|nr:fibronectin type III domain-containing protein [Armatimonadota bacterium]